MIDCPGGIVEIVPWQKYDAITFKQIKVIRHFKIRWLIVEIQRQLYNKLPPSNTNFIINHAYTVIRMTCFTTKLRLKSSPYLLQFYTPPASGCLRSRSNQTGSMVLLEPNQSLEVYDALDDNLSSLSNWNRAGERCLKRMEMGETLSPENPNRFKTKKCPCAHFHSFITATVSIFLYYSYSIHRRSKFHVELRQLTKNPQSFNVTLSFIGYIQHVIESNVALSTTYSVQSSY